MQIWKKILCVLVALFVFVLFGLLMPNKTNKQNNVSVPAGFSLYEPGTKIVFSKDGNSSDFVNISNGWGAQEAVYRCAIGNDTIMNLYIPNWKNQDLKLNLSGFGVFKPEDNSQRIEVFVNETKLVDWYMSEKQTYSVLIPDKVIDDGKVSIRFHAANPYIPKGDARKISMAVYSIQIDKSSARKIKSWLKKRFVNLVGEPSPEDLKLYEEWNKTN